MTGASPEAYVDACGLSAVYEDGMEKMRRDADGAIDTDEMRCDCKASRHALHVCSVEDEAVAFACQLVNVGSFHEILTVGTQLWP